jgi:hypothetical protein
MSQTETKGGREEGAPGGLQAVMRKIRAIREIMVTESPVFSTLLLDFFGVVMLSPLKNDIHTLFI